MTRVIRSSHSSELTNYRQIVNGAYVDFMKPVFHPSVDDVTVEGILHALSDPMRVAIFAQIASSSAAQNCSNFLKVRETSIPKSTLSQHFKVLREAGLIRGERQGVEMRNTSRCAEIDQRFPGLIASIINAHRVQSGATASASTGKKKSKSSPRS